MRAKLSDRDYEIISAYLDGQLPVQDRARLEERMRTNADLRTALDEMSHTRALLRMAPRRRAPRNFTLTRAMVSPAKEERRRPAFSLFPVLSFASAVATLALVLSVLFEYSPVLNAARSGSPSYAAAPASESQRNTRETGPFVAVQPPVVATQTVAKQLLASNQPTEPAGQVQSNAPQAPLVNWTNPPAYGLGGGSGQDVGNQGSTAGSSASDEAQVINPQIAGANRAQAIPPGGYIYDYNVVVPPDSASGVKTQGTDQSNVSPETSSGNPPSSQNAGVTGNGPILGAPGQDQGGKTLNNLPTPMPTNTPGPTRTATLRAQVAEPAVAATPADVAQAQTLNQNQEQPEEAPAINGFLIAQVALAVIALGAGIGAYLYWRKAR